MKPTATGSELDAHGTKPIKQQARGPGLPHLEDPRGGEGPHPSGPARRSQGEPGDVKVLPLRLEGHAVEQLDEDWRSRGIKSRTEFLRRALAHYLTHLGANDAAALFAAGAAQV